MATAGRPTRRALLALALASLCLAPAASAYDTSGAKRAIWELNAQRAANGLPPVSLDQRLLKSRCTLQNHFIASTTQDWGAAASPWDEAPIHQSFLYDPLLDRAAYAVYSPSESSFPFSSRFNWTCMWMTGPSRDLSQGPPSFYAFTDDQGRKHVAPLEWPYEYPVTPEAVVGLTEGQFTGPNLILYAVGIGDSPHIQSASLTTSTGQSLETRFADGTTVYHGQHILEPYAAIIIPVHPLDGHRTYIVHVTWQGDDGKTYPQTVSFSTEFLSNRVRLQVLPDSSRR